MKKNKNNKARFYSQLIDPITSAFKGGVFKKGFFGFNGINKKTSGRVSHSLASVLVIVAFIAQFFVPLASNAEVIPTTNPLLGQSCGLDIALVLDSSGSIDITELGQMKSAFKDFVDVFLPGTPTEFSVTEFDTTASVRQAFTPNVTLLDNAIDGAVSGGATNWKDGLIKAQSTFDPRPSVPNLIIFSSDGEPNIPGGGLGFEQDALDVAITRANLIKNGGTRIITLGIGVSGSNADHLKAISSDDAYYSAVDFGALATTLHQLATDLCGGHLTVTKRIGTPENWTSASTGWTFNIGSYSGEQTDSNGQTAAVELSSGIYDVIETGTVSGYSFGSASCSGAANNGSPSQNGVTGVQINSENIVSCVFYNTPNAGTLTVIKQVVNSQDNPSIFNLYVSNGTPGSFPGSASGVPVSIPGGASYNVTEDIVNNYTEVKDSGCSGIMPPGGQATCTVVNTYVSPEPTQGSLNVTKIVTNNNGGTAVVTDFSLFVDQTPVTSGASTNFDEGTYTISETGNPNYAATYSGDCANEGHTVTIVAGNAYTCTITNDDIQPELTVVKVVNGGDAQVSDFSLFIDGLSVISGIVNEMNAGTYTVSEISQSSYTCAFSGGCNGNGSVTLAIGDSKTCTLTNTFVPQPKADLSVSKSVDDEDRTVDIGQPVTFTITVKNLGPDDATGVVLKDLLPSGLTFVSASSTPGNYTTSTGEWSIGALANGDSALLEMKATVSAESGKITNEASVSLIEIDPNSDNDTSSVVLTVNDVTPPPTPPPPLPSGGGTGGGSTDTGGGGGGFLPASDAYQNWLNQQAAPAPSASPAGPAATPTPAPQGEVKGVTTLPATGFDLTEALALVALMLVMGAFALVARKRLNFDGLMIQK